VKPKRIFISQSEMKCLRGGVEEKGQREWCALLIDDRRTDGIQSDALMAPTGLKRGPQFFWILFYFLIPCLQFQGELSYPKTRSLHDNGFFWFAGRSKTLFLFYETSDIAVPPPPDAKKNSDVGIIKYWGRNEPNDGHNQRHQWPGICMHAALPLVVVHCGLD